MNATLTTGRIQVEPERTYIHKLRMLCVLQGAHHLGFWKPRDAPLRTGVVEGLSGCDGLR